MTWNVTLATELLAFDISAAFDSIGHSMLFNKSGTVRSVRFRPLRAFLLHRMYISSHTALSCWAVRDVRDTYRQYSRTLCSISSVRRPPKSLLWPPCVADADILFYPCGFFFFLPIFPRHSQPSQMGCLPYFHTYNLALVRI